METKKPKGRPRKSPDVITPSEFGFAAEVLSTYNILREHGAKHSAAVRETVEKLRKGRPNERTSATKVKRILATWQSQDAETILRFDPKEPTPEATKKLEWIRNEIIKFRRENGLSLEEVPPSFGQQRGATYTLRFAPRPTYPRHNRKTPDNV